MKVILLTDVESLGSAGEVVRVKPGYARNFLIPKSHAIIATDTNVAQFESKRRQHEAVSEKEKRIADGLAKKLEADSLTIQVKVGDEDKLFGSVTGQNIVDLLIEKGYQVDRRAVQLDEPIRALGAYTIPVRVHADVTTKVKLWVVKE